MKNYYDILEISFTSTIDQIKKAYRLKAVQYHPDKHFGDKYFADKFIEIKEAYEILSDLQKRSEYDNLYNSYFAKEESTTQQNHNDKKQKEKEKVEQFFYDPYKPFYSYQDRLTNETPQFIPKTNHWGKELPENSDFFILPKNIGKIISGYTTLTKQMQPSTQKENITRFVKYIGIAIAISLIIIFGFGIQNPIWIIVWGLSPLIIAMLLANSSSNFKHENGYIGVNGFADFKCEGTRDNVVSSSEVNFKDVTDLLRVTTINKKNYNYSNTTFGFVWLNNNKIVKETHGTHYSKENTPEEFYFGFWLNDFAERYWTVYLLDNMEKDLESKGYIEFSTYGYADDHYIKIPNIHLGIGYIKFLSSKGDTTYNFNEIKKVYRKGTNLFIEHTNYEKKFLFFESGNKNGIPLMSLSNRQFFFRAMELLLGYKFS